MQTADMNISLSAIALMWAIVDFLSQDSPQKGDVSYVYPFFLSILLPFSRYVSPLTCVHRENAAGEKAKLWLAVFREMKTLCLDPRSETRNCALVTLFKAVATHGPSLTSEIWSALLSQVLSPLLGEARVASEKANTEETVAELGREGGKSVKMCVLMIIYVTFTYSSVTLLEVNIMLNGCAQLGCYTTAATRNRSSGTNRKSI